MLRASCWLVVLTLMISATAQPAAEPLGGAVAAPAAIRSVATRAATAFPAATRPTTVITTSSRPAATRGAFSRPVASTQAHKVETIEYDFGKVWAGELVKHTFEVTNKADRTLGILDVHATCGCTTTSKWDKEVQPGDVWNLEVSLGTANRKGPMRKGVTVKTDDPDRPEIYLVLKGEIRSRFEFAPGESINFGAMQVGTPAKRTLTITNKTEGPVAFTSAKPSTEFIKADLREVEPGQQYELDVETVPPLPEGGSLGNITLETDLKEQPKMAVQVYASVRPRVYLSPKTMSAPMPAQADIHRLVQVITYEGTKVNVLDVETSNPAMDATVDPGDQSQRIRVTIPKGTDFGTESETITIHTDDPEFAKMVCEVRPYKLIQASSSRPTSSQPARGRLRTVTSAPTSRAAAPSDKKRTVAAPGQGS